MARMSATEAGRNFSEALNRVAAGEEIEIARNGAPIAILAPPQTTFLSPERFRELLDSAPPADDDFADDLRRIRVETGPAENPWPS